MTYVVHFVDGSEVRVENVDYTVRPKYGGVVQFMSAGKIGWTGVLANIKCFYSGNLETK